MKRCPVESEDKSKTDEHSPRVENDAKEMHAPNRREIKEILSKEVCHETTDADREGINHNSDENENGTPVTSNELFQMECRLTFYRLLSMPFAAFGRFTVSLSSFVYPAISCFFVLHSHRAIRTTNESLSSSLFTLPCSLFTASSLYTLIVRDFSEIVAGEELQLIISKFDH
jgi:hypothetical protein